MFSIHHLVKAQAMRLSIKSTYSLSHLTGLPFLFIGTLIFATVIMVQTVKEMKRKSPTHDSDVARFWLGVTFYGAPLPPVRLLWTN